MNLSSSTGFAFRTDPARNLSSISKSGLWMGSANSRDGQKPAMKAQFPNLDTSIPVESGLAKLMGWEIPPDTIMACPRLYFWRYESDKKRLNNNNDLRNLSFTANLDQNRYALLRFPLALLTEFSYMDGILVEDTGYYCVYPGNSPKNIAVGADLIEVKLEEQWLSLMDYIST